MNSTQPTLLPDFSLGFVDVMYINTLLNLILTDKPLLSNDVYLWLDRKGYRSKRAENTLRLLEYASVIKAADQHYVVTSDFLKATGATNPGEALKRFILASISDDDLKSFIKNAYTPYAQSLVWRPESISPFQVQLRDFLVSLQLLRYEHGLIRAEDFFTEHLAKRGLLESLRQSDTRRVSSEELLVALEIKNELGELAEKLALEFEKTRTAGYGKLPVRISKDDVSAGYDIESYDNADSRDFDRHIEVKYFNNGHFYISKNELDVAKALGTSYWLYLVTVKNEKDYLVEMVNDPYSNIIESDGWDRECVQFRIEKSTEQPPK